MNTELNEIAELAVIRGMIYWTAMDVTARANRSFNQWWDGDYPASECNCGTCIDRKEGMRACLLVAYTTWMRMVGAFIGYTPWICAERLMTLQLSRYWLERGRIVARNGVFGISRHDGECSRLAPMVYCSSTHCPKIFVKFEFLSFPPRNLPQKFSAEETFQKQMRGLGEYAS